LKLKFDHYQFNQTESNGIPVFWKNFPWANGFAYVQVIVAAGARHDPVGKEGLAHFLEHLPFDGCSDCPNFESIEAVNRSLFQGNLNARTGFDATVYGGKFLIENFDPVMRFLGNFISSPTISPTDFERERLVIIREIWRYFNSPKRAILAKELKRMIYGGHTFGRQTLPCGWHETVEKLTVEDIRAFHDLHYRNSNIRIVIGGDISESDLDRVSKLTNQIANGHSVTSIDKPLVWPHPLQNEYTISVSEYFNVSGSTIPNQAEIQVIRCMPFPKNPEVASLAQDLIRKILFTQIRGRLGATYAPHVSITSYTDHFYFGASVKIEPCAVKAVTQIILKTIDELASFDTVHQPLFDESKVGHSLGLRSIDSSIGEIVNSSVQDLVCRGNIEPSEEDLLRVSKVTYDDICSLMRDQFKPEQLFWHVANP